VAEEQDRREDEEDGAGDERQRVETVRLHDALVIRSILTSPADACTDSWIGRSAPVPWIVSSIVRSTPPRDRSSRAIKTVETHVSSVLRKLQLSSRHELSRWAADRRFV
jgi:hypothetical protein